MSNMVGEYPSQIFITVAFLGMAGACSTEGGKNKIELNLQETRSNLKNITKLWKPFLDLFASKYVPMNLVRRCLFVHSGRCKEVVIAKSQNLSIHTIRSFSRIFFVQKTIYSHWWKDFGFRAKHQKKGNYWLPYIAKLIFDLDDLLFSH